MRTWFAALAVLLTGCVPAQVDTASERLSPAQADAASEPSALVRTDAATERSPSPPTDSRTPTETPTAPSDVARSAPAVAAAGGTESAEAADDAAAVAERDTGISKDTAADDTEAQPQAARPRQPRLVATRPGDSGAKVERLQRRLARLGFAPGPVDGAYGPRTRDAVEAFQMLASLEQTGRANKATVSALAAYEPDVKILRAGDRGKAVKRLQRRLAQGPFDPGPVDGAYGAKTVQAVWALEKLAGVPVDGDWGPLDEYALGRLEAGEVGGPAKRHKKRWVEFDLSQQVMKVYDPGKSTPVLISHGSSGNGIPWSNEEHSGSSITPPGDFVITRRIAGWRESSLDIGRLYNPLYFNGGIAFHGALSVPLYPASHGCVRLPMHIAEYLPDELPNGTRVHVLK